MSGVSEETRLRIIAADESDRVEFKESLAGSASIAIREAICAFANDLAGYGQPGLVFVGVKTRPDDRQSCHYRWFVTRVLYMFAPVHAAE